MKNANYALIDIFKLFFALGIVALHSGFLLNQPYGFWIHTNIFRIGVPFFFIVSGFFLASNYEIDSENEKIRIKKSILKNIKLYYALGIIYIIIGIIRSGYNANDLINQIWYLITFRSLSVIWFVGALICSTIVLLHIKSKKSLVSFLIIFLLLYLIGLSFNTYSFLFAKTRFWMIYNFLVYKFGNNSNFLFLGAFYVLLGYYIRKYGKFNDKKIVHYVLLLLGIGITVFETIIIKNNILMVTNYEYYLGHIFTVPALLSILINSNLNINTMLIRNLS